MTTETAQLTRPRGRGVLLGAALGSLAAGLVLSLVGAVVTGSAAAGGALVGTALVLVVFVSGTLVVGEVARVMPSAALLVALLTYALQVAAMALMFLVVSRSGLLDETLARGWLAGAVIGGTLVWVSVQVLLASRERIPHYDLSPGAGVTGPATARAGER